MTVTVRDVQTLLAVTQALLDRFRSDYDVQLLHARKPAADLEQRCNRCGLWIQLGQAIALIEKSDRSRKDWVHEVCPTPAIPDVAGLINGINMSDDA
jgi:hypothetical protein